MFHQCELSLPVGTGDVPQECLDEVGEPRAIRNFTESYFAGVHHWFPILSEKRFSETVLNPWSRARPDVILLLLCMKLVDSSPDRTRPDAIQSLYLMAKSLHLNSQIASCLSLQILQATLLIAVYEMGHSIYPAAYITIGTCARLGGALGVDKVELSVSNYPTWSVEREERNRAWWATVILDRFAALGCPDRPLCTESPGPDSFLPTDDIDWNNGVSQPSWHRLE